MRQIKLTGREATVLRAIGFADALPGAEIQDSARMEPDDLTDTLNALLAAGFIQSIPFSEMIDIAQMCATSFEVNPAYVHELRQALIRR